MTTYAWPRVAVMGAGAVGCYFGGMLARAGADVTLIGRARHVEAIARAGLRLQSLSFDEHIPLAATTDVGAVGDAEIVLVSVKTPDTEAAARALAPHLGADARVVSLQNGVDNAQRISQHLRQALVVPAVVYVAAEMIEPGYVKHKGRGDLIIGTGDGAVAGEVPRLSDLAAMFERAAVPCRVSAHIDVDLWTKLATNCAYNGVSALTRLKYGPIASARLGQGVLESLVHEVVAVAQAKGIPLAHGEMVAATFRLANAMPDATSSTAQDLARGRRTEIDELNGLVARQGDELGVPTPVNRTICALVKLLESASTIAP